jgi:hypothetical protein
VPAAPGYTVAVRALCEFTAKRGDLDLRFTPSPTGAEGVEGHGVVTARRGVGYQTEVALSGDWGPLRVRGRADGWDPVARRLEEIKTYRGDLAHQPNNHRQLHWAQARVYGALICHQLGLQQVALALVYYNIDTRQETVFTETGEAATLQAFFEEQCRHFAAWSAQETAHRAARDEALRALAFPMPAFRTGQRELAEAVYRAARAGRCLMAQAPTGIGKTVGTLFPLLRAMPPDASRPGSGLDKVFYLAAKTPGRQLALDALQSLRAGLPQAPLRVLELVARDKACEHPDKACHGESCPLARGFYDRLSAARQAAVDAAGAGLLARERVRAVALQHQVCPYYLAQELARWADVVVGDYNYWFDTSALLFALTQMDGWRVAVLVDEAHNLVERARSMYSAELEQGALRALRRSAAPVSPPLKRALDRLNRHWNALQREQRTPYAASDALPDAFVEALNRTLSTLTDLQADQPALAAELAPSGADLQRFYFDALHFARLAESFGPHSLFDITLRPWPRAPARAPSRVHPVHPQHRAGAAPAAAPGRGAGGGAVFRHAEPAGLPRRPAGFAGQHGLDRCAIALCGAAAVGARGPPHLHPLGRPLALAGAHRGRHCRPVRGAARLVPGLLQQLRLPGPGLCPPARAAPGPALLGAAAPDARGRARGLPGALHAGGAGCRFRGAGWGVCRGHRSAGRAPDRRLHRHAGPAAGESGQRADQGPHGGCVCRARLRLHLPLPRPAEGGAGRRAGDPQPRRRRRAGADGRPFQPRRGARAVAGLVGGPGDWF